MSSAVFFPLFGAVLLPALLALWAGSRPDPPARAGAWSAFSTGLLVGCALLFILPDLRAQALPVLAGALLLALVDRAVHPLCAACGGTWGLWPVWIALSLHAVLDGALLELAPPASLASWALLAHRIPEGFATVVVLRSARPAEGSVAWPAASLQLMVGVGFLLTGQLNLHLLSQAYAFVGGAVLYLALHRLHRSWREEAFNWWTFSGAAGVGVLRYGLHVLTQH